MPKNFVDTTRTQVISDRSRVQDLLELGIPEPLPQPPARSLEEDKRAAEAQIDDFMRKVGYANPAERTDGQGWRWFELGSARGRAGVLESEGALFLRAEALVMALPSDRDLILPLMRELLEVNITLPGSGRVGIMNEAVFAAVTRPVADLRPEDFAQCIHSVMLIADSIDDELRKKYGGTSKQRTPAVGAC